jgi:hypothetical protein
MWSVFYDVQIDEEVRTEIELKKILLLLNAPKYCIAISWARGS